jgi:adenylate cyclase
VPEEQLLDNGVYLNTPYMMSLLAGSYQRAGRIAQALQTLDDAQQSIDARGERWWEAEVHRLRGEILLSRSAEDARDAEGCFQQALELARAQGALSLELRAAASLTRFGQREDGGDTGKLLKDCYARFSEGFDTADLRAAKHLLDTTK